MKKLFSLILSFFLLSTITFASNLYNQYGSRTGSYRTGSNGTTAIYDSYGRRTGTLKTDSNGRTTQYDAYGRRVGSYK